MVRHTKFIRKARRNCDNQLITTLSACLLTTFPLPCKSLHLQILSVHINSFYMSVTAWKRKDYKDVYWLSRVCLLWSDVQVMLCVRKRGSGGGEQKGISKAKTVTLGISWGCLIKRCRDGFNVDPQTKAKRTDIHNGDHLMSKAAASHMGNSRVNVPGWKERDLCISVG